jgi:DNA methylase N-4/N-6 domain protein
MANKLELTWYGKDEPIRVEPRLLIENPALSNVEKDADTGNMLIHGDNLLALKALETRFAGQVKCIYIDPPFNTGQAFENYDDNLEMSIWLDLMRSRLQILHTLLKDDGTLFVHIDDQNLPYITILLDEIFGKQNRLYLITFKQGAATGHKAINPGCVTTTNFVLIYSKKKAFWNPHRVYTKRGRDGRYTKFITNIEDEYNDWNIITLMEAFAQANEIDISVARKRVKANPILLEQFVINNAVSVIRTARPDIKNVGKEIQEMVLASKENPSQILYLHRVGNPDMYFINGERILFYKDKLKNIDGELVSAEPLTTLWDDILSNNLHKEGNVSFPKGKKPEYLIKRVLELATDEGDIVMDSFLGSGTTIAVAHKMNRRWIGIEMGEQAYTHCKTRLDAAIDDNDKSGITKAVNWQGGGGYRFYELAPTLINEDSFGEYVINSEYDADMLAAAVALHEGFVYQPSEDLFWKQSVGNENSYLFVTTRHLNSAYMDSIKDTMEEGEYLVIACRSFDSGLDKAYPNITIKKIPQMLLSHCEFGKADYNLNIVRPPVYEDEEECDE